VLLWAMRGCAKTRSWRAKRGYPSAEMCYAF
jgi:hypothetical protein